MPELLLEIGCEELPAWACAEAETQLPGLCERHLGQAPSRVLVGPRRLVVLVDELPGRGGVELVKGPPAALRERAAEGFARKHGLAAADLVEQDGFLWAPVQPRPLAERLGEIVRGLVFHKTMVWRAGGLRFPRPVRWLLAKHGSETLELAIDGVPSGSSSFGHRFSSHELEIPDAGAYLGLLRSAGVEPDQAERRRLIVDGLDALGSWADPLGKLDEVVHLVESPVVLGASFDERFLTLPERVIVTAMQSHQRYFPLGGTRFAVVAGGGEPETVRMGHESVLSNRLDDARFTFERDVAVGIDGLAARLGSITFFAGAGTYADKTERLVELVAALGGDETAREAASLAKADQAAELVREFPDLEGAIGAEYARLSGRPEPVCLAIAEQYLPDGADAPLPSTPAGRVLAAADKLDTLTVSFSLGHRPSGSRDPFGLRRAAIGLCRLAVEGEVEVRRELMPDDVREFVEERLEGYLDVPVEFVRAARASRVREVGGVARLAHHLAGQEALPAVHEVYTRARRIVGDAADEAPVDETIFSEQAERDLAAAIRTQPPPEAPFTEVFAWAASLAPLVERFFVDVLVMDPDERVRANRLRLLRDLRDAVGRLGDLSQIPL
ncbi:MAG TPA: glycine--tRNA ligase subunit beta [Gaiellaceae bacterium]|nr:glycine--tRNA ligase subunit beta [Gaiellaceae bacterium]